LTIPAVLALEDGSLFHGTSIGVAGVSSGEVVFNTAMTGYQEIMTDPSYYRQLVTLTYPHIGNVGVNEEDAESDGPKVAGLIIRDESLRVSNWRAQQSLADYLRAHQVVAIGGIDIRQLTRLLRSRGAMSGAIVAGEGEPQELAQRALLAVCDFPGMNNLDLAQVVSTQQIYEWNEPLPLMPGEARPKPTAQKYHVVAYDYGVKRNILRMLVSQGCRVTVVPAKTPVGEALALRPDGVFLSNGPGDPAPCDYAIKAIQELLKTRIPLFGICLGHQLLGLACGARTIKMKFGHHGANHPVLDLESRRVMISSQNHGFAVDEATLPAHVKATHRSLFDGSLQGIKLVDQPAFSFQGHPEASPGPHDVRPLFRQFYAMMAARGGY